MSISISGMAAYQKAMADFVKAQDEFSKTSASITPLTTEPAASFSGTLTDSLSTVNAMQTEKAAMVQAFASGENQNVHELMITLQKAGLAVNLTTAVRNKVLESYKELSKLQF